VRCNALQQISDEVEELLAVPHISSFCHACYSGKGWGKPGAAFAAQHSSESLIWRNEFATVSRDRAVLLLLLLLSWAQSSYLLPLMRSKPSREGSSSKLQVPKPSSSKDRETVAWSLTPLRIFSSLVERPRQRTTLGVWRRQTCFSPFLCNFLMVTTSSLSIYSTWCSHPFSLAAGGYVVPCCRSSCVWQGQQVHCHRYLGSYFCSSHSMLSVIRNSRQSGLRKKKKKERQNKTLGRHRKLPRQGFRSQACEWVGQLRSSHGATPAYVSPSNPMQSHRDTRDVSAPEAICTLDNLPRNNEELLRVTGTLLPREDQPRNVSTDFTEEEREQSPGEGSGNGSALFWGSLLPGGAFCPGRGMQTCTWLGAGAGAEAWESETHAANQDLLPP